MAKLLQVPHCPRDHDKLKEHNVELPGVDAKVDVCPTCAGVYFDRNEIKRITGHDKLNELLTQKLGIDSNSPLVCPGCGWVMDAEDADGIETDVCLKCFGVWLDRGELERLKAKPDAAFASFSNEKIAELQRAEDVRARDRKQWWRTFLHRLAGLDLLERAKTKPPRV